MLKTAKNYAEHFGAKFVFTGEVLGQRPMSQHLRTMKMIEKECGLAGYLLRPLSAKLLDITVPEQSGWINRENLYAIEGRSRKIQMKLAEEFNIVDYPAPAGGCCVLLDKNYTKKFKDLIAYSSRETITWEQLTLLKVGRHLRIHPQLKVIVGREEAENNFLNRYASTHHLFKSTKFPGATVVADGLIDETNEKIIASIAAYYSDARLHQTVEIVHTFCNTMKLVTVPPAVAQEILKMRI
jgi:tRNA U34 2-thiouridine synthase MnmA/TrmU